MFLVEGMCFSKPKTLHYQRKGGEKEKRKGMEGKHISRVFLLLALLIIVKAEGRPIHHVYQ